MNRREEDVIKKVNKIYTCRQKPQTEMHSSCKICNHWMVMKRCRQVPFWFCSEVGKLHRFPPDCAPHCEGEHAVYNILLNAFPERFNSALQRPAAATNDDKECFDSCSIFPLSLLPVSSFRFSLLMMIGGVLTAEAPFHCFCCKHPPHSDSC